MLKFCGKSYPCVETYLQYYWILSKNNDIRSDFSWGAYFTDWPNLSIYFSFTLQSLVEQFAEITGTDEACAQFYLQDRKWDLEVNLKFAYIVIVDIII